MKQCEKTAIIQYVEFMLLTLCDTAEKMDNPGNIGDLYLLASEMLTDFEDTIGTSGMYDTSRARS